jgi:hypothetical protein
MRLKWQYRFKGVMKKGAPVREIGTLGVIPLINACEAVVNFR